MNLEILPRLPYNVLVGVVIAPFIGSFVATAVERFSAGKGFVAGRSHCNGCGLTLRFSELIPIGSWVAQRGQCRRCGVDIGWQPLAIEGAYLLVTLVTALFTSDRIFWAGCLLGWSLLALALTDLRTLLLPDKLTLPLIIAGIIETAFFNPESVFDHIVAAAMGFLSFYIIIKTYRALTGREGLGLGDAKLFAATGAWLGALALPGALLIAASIAISVELMRRFSTQNQGGQEQIAFGPYLAFATWLGWVIGPLIPLIA